MSDPDRFGWNEETQLIVSQCSVCAHAHTTGPTCSAYLDGIPDEIMYNEHDHRQFFDGDHGIRFDPLPGQRSPFEVNE